MRGWIPIAALGGVLLAGPAGAQERDTEDHRGAVVHIDGDDLFVDLTAEQLDEGTELDVYREVRVRHPVTGESLEDQFVIGRVRVVQAREALSLVRTEDAPSRPIQVGDIVRTQPPEAPEDAVEPASDESREASPDPARAAVLEAWRATLGARPEKRIAIYERYLRAHPRSPYAPAVRRELSAMRHWAARRDGAGVRSASARARGRDRLGASVRGQALARTREGRATEVAVTFDPEGPVRGLVLYVRPDDEEAAYQRVSMTRDENGHARGTVPEALVVPPGFDYFVVAVDDRGHQAAVMGEPDDPIEVQVEPAGELEPDGPPRAQVRLSSELVSFNGAEGDDWMLLGEGDFLYRTLFGPIYAVRVGYGHFRGEGAPLADLDAGRPAEEAAFTYGFFEMELRLHRLFAVMARTTVGLGLVESEVGQESGLRGGFQLRVRIGEERGTNLVLAGETIPEIGQLAYIGLRWEALEGWPMAAEVHVTDQPVNSGDLAVRGVLEAGRRFGEVATLSARLSFQGRRTDHSGFGAGLAATFDW